MAPWAKGVSGNPDGRPRAEHPRVMFAARADRKTVAAIVREAKRRGIGRGVLLDEIVADALGRKRKP